MHVAIEGFAEGLLDETAMMFSRFKYVLNLQSETMGARYVLESALRRAGSKVRLSAKVIDSGSGLQIWADRIDVDGDDPFAV